LVGGQGLFFLRACNPAFTEQTSLESFNAWGKFMAADEYRRNAIECFRIADETISAQSRVLLIHMAESWLRLADQAEKNHITDLVYETPDPRRVTTGRDFPSSTMHRAVPMSDSPDSTFGHRLRVTRIALGISEQEVADTLGVSLPTYRKYERGTPMKSAAPAMRFARKYDVNLYWLFDGDASGAGCHLRNGKVAILPAKGPPFRERMKEYHAALFKAELWRRSLLPPECPAPLDIA
jgi:transcriptional regulator with XRE-family HTH domain